MRLRVQCQVGKPPNEDIAAHDAVTEDVTLAHPRATLKMLRATVAVKFRLPIQGFAMHYAGARDGVDLSNEDELLSACGLQDDDVVLLLSRKRLRELTDASAHDAVAASNASPPPLTTSSAATPAATAQASAQTSTNTTTTTTTDSAAAADDVATSPPPPSTTASSAPHATGASNTSDMRASAQATLQSDQRAADTANHNDDGDRSESEAESEDDKNSNSQDGDGHDSDGGDDDEDDELGEEALYEHLLSLDSNLNDMRQAFIAKPKEVMQRIQAEDPTLFRLISANQEAFVRIINNEDEVRALQEEKEMADDDYDDDDYEEGDSDDEEGAYEAVDEATARSIHNTYLQLLEREVSANAHDDTGDAQGNASRGGSDSVANTSATPADAYASLTPTADEDEKINSLAQLGFTYAQAKFAFYKCRRSIERAANYLFESPPPL